MPLVKKNKATESNFYFSDVDTCSNVNIFIQQPSQIHDICYLCNQIRNQKETSGGFDENTGEL